MQIKTSAAVARISESLEAVDAAKGRIVSVEALREKLRSLRDTAECEDTPDNEAEKAAKDMIAVSEELRLTELAQGRRAAALAKAEHASMVVSGEVLDLLHGVAMEKDAEATEVALAFAKVVLNEQAPVSVVGRTAGLLRGVYDLTDLIELINSTQMLSTIAKSYATLVILEQWSDGIKNISKSIDALRDATKLFPVGCEMLAR